MQKVAVSSGVPTLIEDAADLEWETTLQREPYDVELWIEYAEDKTRRGLPPRAIAMVYERALNKMPGSYKLWNTYLDLRRSWITVNPASIFDSPLVVGLNATFERALVYMNRMPKIWLKYCDFLVEQRSITTARRTFDRALCSLPPTQHNRVWEAYSRFVSSVPEIPWRTAERILRRRVGIDPEEGRAALVQFLRQRGKYAEAARVYVEILHAAKEGSTRKEVRTELFALAKSHPEECRNLVDFEAIIKDISTEKPEGMEERVKLYVALADHLLQLGEFDHARDVFERTMANECHSIRDFALVFETYSRFEEAILDESEEAGDDKVEIGFRCKRMRHLLENEKKLASQLFLQAWPGDVQERLHHCAHLLRHGKDAEAEKLIKEAFPEKEPLDLFNGKGATLFTLFAETKAANRPEANLSMKERDSILALGCKLCWDLHDVVELWRLRIELAIENNDPQRALKLAKEAITPPSTSQFGELMEKAAAAATTAVNGGGAAQPAKRRPSPHKSYLLWCLYLDLEENFGTLETARAAYEQALELKVASVLNVLNYCKMLRKHDFHEDSYSVFERALTAFPWPHTRELWIEYLKRFIERYQGTKVERARDLFEQCISTVPETNRRMAEFAFLNYAKFEEEFGLGRRALQIYERWASFVPDDQKCDAFQLWAAKCEEMFGAPAARKVYEQAISTLNDLDVARVCVRYADLERRLGEMERARGILKHGSQFADPANPKRDAGLWTAWNDFEVKYGDEETFKEMLRIKRSVQAHYSILHVGEDLVPSSGSTHPDNNANFHRSSSNQPTSSATSAAIEQIQMQQDMESEYVDPDEINLDEEEEEEEPQNDQSSEKNNDQ